MTITIPLSRPKLEEARTTLRDAGVDLREDTGTVEHKGVVAQYAYENETLTIEVLTKPVLVSQAKVEWVIREWFA